MAPTLDSIEANNRAEMKQENSISFQKLLDEIRLEFSRPDKRVDVDELWRILKSYKSNPADWDKFAYYDPYKYKRNLVDGQHNYNVMVLTWSKGTKSCIHDHSGSHCFMKILDGELVESRYAWPKSDKLTDKREEMKLISEARLNRDQVLYINDKVGLHQVWNPNPNKTAASLHVYIPPIRICKAFDIRTGLSEDCKLTFYSERGRIVEHQQQADASNEQRDCLDRGETNENLMIEC